MFLLVLWGGTAIADAFVFYCMLVRLLAFLLCGGETLGDAGGRGAGLVSGFDSKM